MLKQLPSNIEAEQSILASMIIDIDVLEKFFEEFDVEIFYEKRHIEIIEVIFELCNEWIAVDIITLKDKWIDVEYLINITTILPTSANRYFYAKIVENEYKRREIIKEARRIENQAYNYELSVEENVESSFNKFNNILTTWNTKALSTDKVIDQIKKHLEESKNKWLLWYSWGLDWLNEYTSWIRWWKTYRIAWSSWLWKTNLFYSMIPNLLKQWAKILFVSLENSVESTYIKLMSSVLWNNPTDIEKWVINFDYDWMNKYRDKLYITDQIFDLDDIKREALKIKPDIILLDYIQLVEIKWSKNELEKLDTYAREVKKFMQKNNKIAWIDISQLNMNANSDDLKKSWNFKWSWELKNAIDFWLHLFYYEPFFKYKETAKWTPAEKATEKLTAIEFVITKNRLWPTFWKTVLWINFDEWIRYKTIPKETLEKWF